jgi:Uma2 family endonuclease
MNAPARIAAPTPKASAGFTAREYVKLNNSGAFGEARVELVRGELRKMMPSDWAHSEGNMGIGSLLRGAYQTIGARVGADAIIVLADDTVRAGDIVVVEPGFSAVRPSADDVILVVEIANTTLADDLGDKAQDYGAAGIPEYWVVDVSGKNVHVMTGPDGTGYMNRKVVRFGEPLAVPGTDQTIVID